MVYLIMKKFSLKENYKGLLTIVSRRWAVKLFLNKVNAINCFEGKKSWLKLIKENINYCLLFHELNKLNSNLLKCYLKDK